MDVRAEVRVGRTSLSTTGQKQLDSGGATPSLTRDPRLAA